MTSSRYTSRLNTYHYEGGFNCVFGVIKAITVYHFFRQFPAAMTPGKDGEMRLLEHNLNTRKNANKSHRHWSDSVWAFSIRQYYAPMRGREAFNMSNNNHNNRHMPRTGMLSAGVLLHGVHMAGVWAPRHTFFKYRADTWSVWFPEEDKHTGCVCVCRLRTPRC